MKLKLILNYIFVYGIIIILAVIMVKAFLFAMNN